HLVVAVPMGRIPFPRTVRPRRRSPAVLREPGFEVGRVHCLSVVGSGRDGTGEGGGATRSGAASRHAASAAAGFAPSDDAIMSSTIARNAPTATARNVGQWNQSAK